MINRCYIKSNIKRFQVTNYTQLNRDYAKRAEKRKKLSFLSRWLHKLATQKLDF